MVSAVFKTVGRVEASGGSIPPSSVKIMEKNQLSALPQIETLLKDSGVKQAIESLSRPIVTEIARTAVEKIRHSVLSGTAEVPPVFEIIEEVIAACRSAEREKLQKVVNATGIIIHTNMGRAPLLREVWKEAEEINCGYSNLEFDLKTGKRGKRKGLIPSLLAAIAGAEDALIVNNNAAAVLLMLHTFAEGKEVMVSRGEQVQIGGGFRIPEILAQSGAQLVEIGTTNITTEKDYLNAFSERTAMVLSVHRSNFALRGFASSPSVRELAAIKPRGVLLCVDQGSGVLDETLPGEVSVCSHLRYGADLVSFSGDKVFGGPQAGIIVGKKELIAEMGRHPLMRAFRPGKTVYSLLEGTLVLRLNRGKTEVSRIISMDMKELRSRGRKIIKGCNKEMVSLVESAITTGGGSSPDEYFHSLSVRIDTEGPADRVLKALRAASPPIIGTISEDRVHLNLSTIQEDEIPHIRRQLEEVLGA